MLYTLFVSEDTTSFPNFLASGFLLSDSVVPAIELLVALTNTSSNACAVLKKIFSSGDKTSSFASVLAFSGMASSCSSDETLSSLVL